MNKDFLELQVFMKIEDAWSQVRHQSRVFKLIVSAGEQAQKLLTRSDRSEENIEDLAIDAIWNYVSTKSPPKCGDICVYLTEIIWTDSQNLELEFH